MNEAGIEAETVTLERQLPGLLLRQTREAQGLTLGEVSGALKFSTRQIEALEKDDFEQLQGKTFLRGFIRAYARMLKLQPEAVLALLDAQESVVAIAAVEQIVPPDNMGETDPMPFYRRHGRKFSLVIAALVVAVAATWFYGNEQTASVNVNAANTVQPSAVVVPVMLDADHLSVTASMVESVSGTAAPSLAAGAISFEFSDRSWLEVKDANGQTLLTGEFPGGQSQVANGKPPYQLWIGKASAVKVTYKNQSVDLQPYTRDEVARLTLER